jgi:hypothetical protein
VIGGDMNTKKEEKKEEQKGNARLNWGPKSGLQFCHQALATPRSSNYSIPLHSSKVHPVSRIFHGMAEFAATNFLESPTNFL